MKVKGVIDSLNFTDNLVESVFIHSSNYTIEQVKGKGDIYKPNLWVKAFGKPMGKINNGKLYFPFIEASIISDIGSPLKIPLKRYSANPMSQTVEFAGLHGFTERSELLKYNLLELLKPSEGMKFSPLGFMKLSRCDIAIDYEVIPKSVVKNILKTGRAATLVGTTTYYKSVSEKKSNPYFDIKIYNKTEQLHRVHGMKLDREVMRLEISFKSQYLKGFKGLDVDNKKLIQKMEKTIKKVTGKSIRISPFK